MHLSPNERILKVYYHHYTPFIVRLVKIISATLPFYFILFLFRNSFDFSVILVMHIIVVLLFSVVTIYITLIYWLDRLVVTTRRIVFIDWKYLTVKTEHEAELKDIQDISSTEKGVIALLPIFDYGTIVIKTAADAATIDFPEAPDPDGIKKYVHSLVLHHDPQS